MLAEEGGVRWNLDAAGLRGGAADGVFPGRLRRFKLFVFT